MTITFHVISFIGLFPCKLFLMEFLLGKPELDTVIEIKPDELSIHLMVITSSVTSISRSQGGHEFSVPVTISTAAQHKVTLGRADIAWSSQPPREATNHRLAIGNRVTFSVEMLQFEEIISLYF